MSNAHNTNNKINESGTTSIDSVRLKSNHLSYAQIRGLIKLFNYHFVQTDATGKKKNAKK